MRTGVVGGTGLVGGLLVKGLEAGGHDTVVLARSQGVDTITGEGLDAALEGVDVVRVEGNDHYAGKRRQEEIAAAGPTTIVRAAQLFDFADLVPSWQNGQFGVEMAGEVLLPGPDARSGSTTLDAWRQTV